MFTVVDAVSDPHAYRCGGLLCSPLKISPVFTGHGWISTFQAANRPVQRKRTGDGCYLCIYLFFWVTFTKLF